MVTRGLKKIFRSPKAQFVNIHLVGLSTHTNMKRELAFGGTPFPGSNLFPLNTYPFGREKWVLAERRTTRLYHWFDGQHTIHQIGREFLRGQASGPLYRFSFLNFFGPKKFLQVRDLPPTFANSLQGKKRVYPRENPQITERERERER